MNQNNESNPKVCAPTLNSGTYVIVDHSNSSASSPMVDNSSIPDCLGNMMKNAILITEVVPHELPTDNSEGSEN